jgi:ketosteroid isomerase-like protein
MLTTALFIACAMPVSAQQQLTPDLQREAGQLAQKFADALNSGDAQAFRALFTKNGVTISPTGMSRGEEVTSDNERFHKMGGTLNLKLQLAEPSTDGGEIIVISNYTVTFTNNPATKEATGNILQFLEREGGTWKIRASAAARVVEPRR